MDNKLRKANNYIAYNMASQLFMETDGINSFSPLEWIEFENIDVVAKMIKPHKKTILHDYIESVYIMHDSYLIDKHFSKEVIEEMIQIFDSYEYRSKRVQQLIDDYTELQDDNADSTEFDELGYKFQDELNSTILKYIVEDIFTALYQNKKFLREFNILLSEHVKKLRLESYSDRLKKDGVLKRAHIPKWLKNGVFLRDKGRCQLCGTDLTGLLSTDKKLHYDHIVPLELGGSNDPTNFQLTCSTCNLKKGFRSMNTNDIASLFWDLD